MKKTVLIFFLSFGAITSMAQKIYLDTLSVEQVYLYRDNAIKMRNTGKVLTIGGTSVFATGIVAGVILINTPVPKKEPDDPHIDSSNLIRGFLIIGFGSLVGITCNAVGIPLWAVGGKRMAGAELAIKQFDYRTTSPMSMGLGITIRF